MKLLIRYINVVIFFLLAGVFLYLHPQQKLSTNLLSLLPQNEETQLLKIYENFKSSREILVASKNLKSIKEIESRVLNNESVELQKRALQNEKLKKYRQDYRFYLQDLDAKNIEHIGKTLQKNYDNLVSNLNYVATDKIDPLGFFIQPTLQATFTLKEGYLYKEGYGYITIFTFQSGVDNQKVYKLFLSEIKEDVKIFSPMFYFVENSNAIKFQVNLLVCIALSILAVLYIVILKDISLLINTVLTLVNSSILALFVVTFLWQEVSLFVMVFGMAISTVAIDYMFHNYFCGFYEKKKAFNKAVFYGFLSTFFAFFVISFVGFPFIKQVALYSLISLSFSYVVFSYVFPKIGFTCKEKNLRLGSFAILKNYKLLVLFLVPFILYNFLHVRMDLDVKNLDYKNIKLKTLERFFKSALGVEDKSPFVIKAQSIDELIEKSREIASLHVDLFLPLSNLVSQKEFAKRVRALETIDFLHVRKEIQIKADDIGFRKGFFANAYPKTLLKQTAPEYALQSIKEYGFDVFYDGKYFYTYGLVSKGTVLKDVYLINSTTLFAKSLKSIEKELLLCGVVILFGVILLLYKLTRYNFFKALSYVLFPVALILFFISFAPINILQIFMLFIIIAMSIDYGIYVSQKELEQGSERAILFSLLSTFAGFGVLVFSSIGVLFYIGEVATLGLVAILILLVIGKK